MSPYLIFPEEVWELILGHLESSEDILAVAKAYPELHPVVTRKGPLWLFDQALPEIYRWLPQKEFFHCRQVCKRWSRVVDTFLETHHDQQAGGEPWLPAPGHPSYDEEQYFKGIRLQSSNFIGKFMKDMEGLPTTNNPFPGRYVCLNARRRRSQAHKDFYGRFGPHIWFIELGCDRSNKAALRLRFCEALIRTLADLPNLRCLVLGEACNYQDFNGENDPSSDSYDNDYVYERKEEDKKLYEPLKEFLPLPPLPYLTTLEICHCPMPIPLAHRLIALCSTQLQRFQVDGRFWNGEVTSFPSLTQLSISEVETKETVTVILQWIEAPQLFNFGAWLLDYIWTVVFQMETDVFPWLRRFPKLRKLDMEVPFSSRSGPEESEPICGASSSYSDADSFLPPIRSLHVMDKGFRLNYNFLLRFPFLEELEILDSFHHIRAEIEISDCSKYSRVKIRESVEADTLYECNVWELLPKLQKLTVKSGGFEFGKRIEFLGNRRMYDYLRGGSKGQGQYNWSLLEKTELAG